MSQARGLSPANQPTASISTPSASTSIPPNPESPTPTGATPAPENNPTDSKTNTDDHTFPLLRGGESVSTRGAAVDSLSREVKLLNWYNGGSVQSASENLNATDNVRLGFSGSFTVNVSDLVAGNTIRIIGVAQATDGGTPAKANTYKEGGPMTLKADGQEIGTIELNTDDRDTSVPDCIGVLTLTVTNTVTGTGSRSFNFTYPWGMNIGYGTSADVMRHMPFTNTIKLGYDAGYYLRNNGYPNNVWGPDDYMTYSYAFNFAAPSPTHDATQLTGDWSAYAQFNNSYFTIADIRCHERIPDDQAFTQLQDSGGASGVPAQGHDTHDAFHVTATQDLHPSDFMIEYGTHYVSASTHKIQAPYGGAEPDEPETAMKSTFIPPHDAGPGLNQARLQQLADADGYTCAYTSRQADGSYLMAATVKYRDTILTPSQIDADTRAHASAYASGHGDGTGDRDHDDVTATRDFYSKALGDSATWMYIVPRFDLTDPYTPATVDTTILDTDGSTLRTLHQTSTPVTTAAPVQTTVTTHYLTIDGRSIKPAIQQAGTPTTVDDGTGGHSSVQARVDDPLVPGYCRLWNKTAINADTTWYVNDGERACGFDSLTSLQQTQLDSLLPRLGLDTTGSQLDNLDNHSVRWTGPGSEYTSDDPFASAGWLGGAWERFGFPAHKDTWYCNGSYPSTGACAGRKFGNIVPVGTPGATEGPGNVNIYLLYIPDPETVHVHWMDMGSNDTATPATGSGTQTSTQTLDGYSGDGINATLAGSIPAGRHLTAFTGSAMSFIHNGDDGPGTTLTMTGAYDENNDTSGSDPSPQEVYIHYADNDYGSTRSATLSRTVTYRWSNTGDTHANATPAPPDTRTLGYTLHSDESFTNQWHPTPVQVGQSAWAPDSDSTFTAVASTPVAGYTASSNAPAITGIAIAPDGSVTDSTGDRLGTLDGNATTLALPTVTVTYSPQAQHVTIHWRKLNDTEVSTDLNHTYTGTDGTPTHTQTIGNAGSTHPGHTDMAVGAQALDQAMPQGTHLVDSSPDPTNPGGAMPVQGHGQDGPGTTYTLASTLTYHTSDTSNTYTLWYADNSVDTSRHASVDRTIHYTYPGGSPIARDTVQTATFTRRTETFANRWHPTPVTVSDTWHAGTPADTGTVQQTWKAGADDSRLPADRAGLPREDAPRIRGYLPDTPATPATTGLTHTSGTPDRTDPTTRHLPDTTIKYRKATGTLPHTGGRGTPPATILTAIPLLTAAALLAGRRHRTQTR